MCPVNKERSLALPLPYSEETKSVVQLQRMPIAFPPLIGPFSGYDPNLPFIHLVDSFGYGREGQPGGTHGAQDLMAPRGTPIVAPVPAKVIKNAWNPYGGWTITLATRLSESKRIAWLYFAHLAAPSYRVVGDVLGAGDLLGFVGNTGGSATAKAWQQAAGPTHCHLTIYIESVAGRGDMLQHRHNFYDQLLALTTPFFDSKQQGKKFTHPGMSNVQNRVIVPAHYRTWKDTPEYLNLLGRDVGLNWSRSHFEIVNASMTSKGGKK